MSARIISGNSAVSVFSRKPRILPSIRWIALESGVLIDGLGPARILKGPFAQTMLPSLLRDMDGSRTISELAEQLSPATREDVKNAISLLDQWGLIEDSDDKSLSDTMTFLRRQIAHQKIGLSATRTLRTLDDLRVLIIHNQYAGSFASLIHSALISSGICRSEIIDAKSVPSVDSVQSPLIISLSEDEEIKSELDMRH
jgi:hypothetical protein